MAPDEDLASGLAALGVLTDPVRRAAYRAVAGAGAQTDAADARS